MADEDEIQKAILSGGLEALTKGDDQTNPKGILLIRFIFKCKQCGKVFPIEDISEIRTALSMEHAQELLKAFAKNVEPRTITCSCSHEAEYDQQDVGFSWE